MSLYHKDYWLQGPPRFVGGRDEEFYPLFLDVPDPLKSLDTASLNQPIKIYYDTQVFF